MTNSKITIANPFPTCPPPLHTFVDQPISVSGGFPLEGSHVFTDFNNISIDIDGVFLKKDEYDIRTVFNENDALNPYSFYLHVKAYISHIADVLEVRSSSTFYRKKGSIKIAPTGAKVLADVKIVPLDDKEILEGFSHLEGNILTPIGKHMATRVVLDYLNDPPITSDVKSDVYFVSEIRSYIKDGLYNDFYTLRTFLKHDGLYADIMYTYSTMAKVGI